MGVAKRHYYESQKKQDRRIHMTCAAHALAASRRMLVAEDVDFIQELVQALLPRDDGLTHLAIDLGAGSGTTALSIFAASPEIRVTTIDPDEEAMGWVGPRGLEKRVFARSRGGKY